MGWAPRLCGRWLPKFAFWLVKGVPEPNENNNILRMVEALLFASSEPLDEEILKERLPQDTNVSSILGSSIVVPAVTWGGHHTGPYAIGVPVTP